MFDLFYHSTRKPRSTAIPEATFTRHTLNSLHNLRAKTIICNDDTNKHHPWRYRFQEKKNIYYVTWMSALPLPLNMHFAWYSHLLYLTPKVQNKSTLSHLFKRNTTQDGCQSSKELLPKLNEYWQDLKSTTDIQRFSDFSFSFLSLIHI